MRGSALGLERRSRIAHVSSRRIVTVWFLSVRSEVLRWANWISLTLPDISGCDPWDWGGRPGIPNIYDCANTIQSLSIGPNTIQWTNILGRCDDRNLPCVFRPGEWKQANRHGFPGSDAKRKSTGYLPARFNSEISGPSAKYDWIRPILFAGDGIGEMAKPNHERVCAWQGRRRVRD